MPEGSSNYFDRLIGACAAYRQRYGEWPAEARMEGEMLWNLAHLFDPQDFVALASRLRLKTKDQGDLSVGGARGVVVYADEGFEHPSLSALELTRTWIGVVPFRGT